MIRHGGRSGTPRGARPVSDGFRLALGTLTVFPIAPPRVVDRRSGSWAMTLAPFVGLLLAAVAALPLWLLGWSSFGGAPLLADVSPLRPAPPELAAALTIGLLALLTRAIHLDGLADTVDGLGSGRPAEEALAIMRKSDIGPFGVVALVLVLLVQVAALTEHISAGSGTLATTLALVTSRLVLPVVCSRGVTPARKDGLGRAVAGSVSPPQLLLAVVLTAAVLGAITTLASADNVVVSEIVASEVVVGETLLRGLVAAATALLGGVAMCWCSVRRFGGVTGDVMGACVEVTFTVALVVLAVV